MSSAPTLTPEILAGWEAAQRLWGVNVARLSIGDGTAIETFAWFTFPPEVHIDPTIAGQMKVHNEWESILAHELGHHILSPATRVAQLKIQLQMARALDASQYRVPPKYRQRDGQTVGLLANLWSDMLINVRVAELQRAAHPDEADPGIVRMFRTLAREDSTPLWWLVMRAYEEIWGLPAGALCAPKPPYRHVHASDDVAAITGVEMTVDARLLATAVKAFGHDPVTGALTAGMILGPYLVNPGSLTSSGCGADGGTLVPTSAELSDALRDPRLRESPRHPLDAGGTPDGGTGDGAGGHGQSLGVARTLTLYPNADAAEVIRAWYQAAAQPYVRPYSEVSLRPDGAGDEIPAALDVWEAGNELAELDWPGTLAVSPVIVPGVTTRRRTWFEDERRPKRTPLSLDLYIDSSGSMPNPHYDSPAILAGIILVLSVLRGGGRVRTTTFSGAGQVAGGDTFTRNTAEAVQGVLHYLGGGTVFPLDLLKKRGDEPLAPDERRHLVVLSDDGCSSLFGDGQPEFAGVAAQVRTRLASGTLILLDPRHSVADAAAEAGYDVEYLDSLQSAPRACAELAARIMKGSARG